MSGILWVCGTPIGNLQDVSLRLVETLKAVDLVACEDTRRALKLLNHLGIRKRLVSYHEHNAAHRLPLLLQKLQEGLQLALVTDAGMPVVSDPGWELVREAAASGIAVRVVPGPSAVVSALAVSGLPGQRFWFEGFLPRQPKRRRERLEALRDLPGTLVFFEAPHRLAASLQAMAEILGARPAACARELTKVHEEVVRGSLVELARRFEQAEPPPLGECTIVVGPPPALLHCEGTKNIQYT
ncbi:MAG: 16S rRNA (cytidine(1402)-2'-O)-methyltransferase [Limnochordaceae bacterium]|nr:16S rRNA (cytidine(1402)-2'-O)-methyltransferase [Limnochordaceae bacterium]